MPGMDPVTFELSGGEISLCSGGDVRLSLTQAAVSARRDQTEFRGLTASHVVVPR